MKQAGEDLSAVMRAEMDRLDWSVSQLARETGFDRGRIYAWWRGDSRPSKASLARVARAMGIDPRTLSSIYGDPAEAHEPGGYTNQLASAINDLVAELAESRRARFDTEVRLSALEAEVRSLRDRPGARAPRGRGAPHS